MNINRIASINNNIYSNKMTNKIENQKNDTQSKSTVENYFDKIMKDSIDKTSSTYSKFAVAKKNYKGTNVFNLNEIEGKLQNTLLSTDVNMFIREETGAAHFRCYFQKTNSIEPITVDIRVPNYDSNGPNDKEVFIDSVKKAILLIDKKISIKNRLGDITADIYSGEFKLDSSTSQLDFKPFIDAFKGHLNNRLNSNIHQDNSLINSSISDADLMKIIKEFDEFILDYL